MEVPWKLHGRDIWPLLESPQTDPKLPCFYEHMGQRYGKDVLAHFRGEPDRGGDKNFPPYVAVVQDGFKLVHYLLREHGEELYDLRNDREELQNLIQKTEHAKLIQKLRDVLKSELKRTEAPFEL